MHSSWKPRRRSQCSTPSATRNDDSRSQRRSRRSRGARRLADAAPRGAARATARWHAALASRGSPEALLARSPQPSRATGSTRTRRAAQVAGRSAPRPLARVARASRTARSSPSATRDYPPLLASSPIAPLALWVEGARPRAARGAAARDGRQPQSDDRRTPNRRAVCAVLERARLDDHERARDRHRRREPSRRAARHRQNHRRARRRSRRDFPARARTTRRRDRSAGVLVSEYAPGIEPQADHFPQRNRIIAGLAARHARRRSDEAQRLADHGEISRVDYGREVFAIPGSIHNPLARGCHSLIREGAKLVEEAGRHSSSSLHRSFRSTDLRSERAAAERDESHTPLDDPEYATCWICLGLRRPRSRELIDARRIDGSGAFLHAPGAGAGRVCRGVARRSVCASGKKD